MAVKDRKNRQLRGSKHCGWGIQKHRGKGSQGGAGNSGWYKQKWCLYSKYFKDIHGSHGFTRHSSDNEIMTINVGDIERNLVKFVNEGKIRVENETYHLNLAAIGYDKLLGNGKISHKFVIEVDSLSEKAKEKIESAGGIIKKTNADEDNADKKDANENKINIPKKDITER